MDINDPLANYMVGTLNFSSTMISPYQFHQVQTQDKTLFQFQLNNAFHHYALQVFPHFDQPNFDWGFAAIDLIWKDRYSPLYKLQAGVGSNGKMLNQRQFGDQWNKQSQKVKDKIIQIGVDKQIKKRAKLSREQLTQSLREQIHLIREFDAIAYKAFIKVIYGVEDNRHLDVSSQKYISIRKNHFNKNYLHEKQKRNTTIQFIQSRNYDIFCMQQCSQDFIEELRQRLPTYVVIQMSTKLSDVCQSIILLKKSTFPGYNQQKVQQQRQKFLTQFTQFIKNPGNFSKKFSAQTINFLSSSIQLQKPEQNSDPIMKIHRQLFWNDDTCYAIVGPFIIFSPHISTKVRINEQQINAIKKSITKLITYFPEKHFIVAGDLNGHFQNQLNFETPDNKFIKVNAFPYHHDDVTCYKMRSLTQAQKRKALSISFCKKDYIITDLKITEPVVIMTDGTQIHKDNAQLIPNDRHPFDHYVVSACLRFTERIESCSPLRRKKVISSPWDGFNLDQGERDP